MGGNLWVNAHNNLNNMYRTFSWPFDPVDPENPLEGWTDTGLIQAPFMSRGRYRRPCLAIVGTKNGVPALLLITGYYGEENVPAARRNACPVIYKAPTRMASLAVLGSVTMPHVPTEHFPEALKQLAAWAHHHTDEVPITPHRMTAAATNVHVLLLHMPTLPALPPPTYNHEFSLSMRHALRQVCREDWTPSQELRESIVGEMELAGLTPTRRIAGDPPLPHPPLPPAPINGNDSDVDSGEDEDISDDEMPPPADDDDGEADDDDDDDAVSTPTETDNDDDGDDEPPPEAVAVDDDDDDEPPPEAVPAEQVQEEVLFDDDAGAILQPPANAIDRIRERARLRGRRLCRNMRGRL